MICPYCCEEIRDLKICPRCDETISERLLGVPQLFFPIAGGTEVGKSHYLKILLEQMKRQAAKFHWEFHAVDDPTMNTYQHYYDRPLRESMTTIAKTAPSNLETRRPLIYLLRLGTLAVALIFYDISGEIFNSETSITKASRALHNASGIFFLIDPFQLPSIRKQYLLQFPNEAEQLPSYNTVNSSVDNLLTRCVNVLNDARSSSGKISVPIAFIISKIDALRFLITNEAPCYLRSLHNGFCALSDFQRNNDYFRNFLFELDEGRDLIGSIGQFEYSCFFGVSSLGQNPQKTQRLQFSPRPLRVLDPILWLLWQNNLIEGR